MFEDNQVHKVPVSAVLALLKEGNTAYFLCYNVAVLLVPALERDFYDQWTEYKEDNFEDQDVKSGYYAFFFIHLRLKSVVFEESIFEDNLTKWVEKYFERSEVDNMARLNYLANDLKMDNRTFRILLLETVLADNPDAMFHVKL